MKLKILIVVLSVILVCLLALVPFVPRMSVPQTPESSFSSSVLPVESSSQVTQPASSQTTVMSTSQPATSQPTTQSPTSQPTTSQPATQPLTNPPMQPTSKPETSPANKPYSENPEVNAFISDRLNTWICPVKDEFGEVVGSRTFASSRGGGKRAHAGLDFVAPHGTKVYAVTAGTVQRVAVFYQNTWAVEVKNDDGSILRYCEIATELETGDRVEQGDIIGTILRADSGTEMVHMEVYYGNGEGMLTQTGNKTFKYVDGSKNFQRRSDLLDPTFLKDLPQ